MASKAPNLQNIPVRTALGRKVRSAFIASPDTVLSQCDFSQEEMRISAHLSQDPGLIDIFQNGKDPHSETARRIFKIPDGQAPDKLTQRDPARHVNFGIAYGLTPPGLTDQIAVTYATAGQVLPDYINDDWSEDLIEEWFDSYKGVRVYLDRQYYRARRYGIVWSLCGRVRRVPEVRSVHSYVQDAGLRQAGNMPIQSCGADWMRLVMGELYWSEQLRELREQNVHVWPLLTVHDELIFEVDEDYGSVVGSIMQDVMRNVFTDKDTGEKYLSVPVEADAKVMMKWEKS